MKRITSEKSETDLNASATLSTADVSEAKRFCSNCGTKILPEEKFCSECGEKTD